MMMVLKRKAKEKRESCRLWCEKKKASMLISRGAEFYTPYPTRVHRELLLTGRPGEMTARQDMEMDVEHGLAGAGAVIDDHPVSLRVQTFIFGDLFCRKEEMSDKLFIGLGHAVNFRYMFFGNNERVYGRLRIHIFKGGHKIIFVDDFGGDFFCDDLAENTVWI